MLVFVCLFLVLLTTTYLSITVLHGERRFYRPSENHYQTRRIDVSQNTIYPFLIKLYGQSLWTDLLSLTWNNWFIKPPWIFFKQLISSSLHSLMNEHIPDSALLCPKSTADQKRRLEGKVSKKKRCIYQSASDNRSCAKEHHPGGKEKLSFIERKSHNGIHRDYTHLRCQKAWNQKRRQKHKHWSTCTLVILKPVFSG